MEFKKYLFIFIILTIIFFVNFNDHRIGLPFHVDSWQMVVNADAIQKNHQLPLREPFSGLKQLGPLGNSIIQASFSTLSGLNLLTVGKFLPGILNAIIALLMYALAKVLFKSPAVALIIPAFQLLVLTQITMLGPFYLVNLTFGMILSLLAFYFLIRRNWIIFITILFALSLTHTSSMVFVIVSAGIYFLFCKELWSKLIWLFAAGIVAIIGFIFLRGLPYFLTLFSNFFMFSKAWPYFQYLDLLSTPFMVLLAIGFFLIMIKEKKAALFLIPIFSFMAIDLFLYWTWHGFFLVYRRLISFIFLLTPFFVGYGVYRITKLFKKLGPLVLLILLIILIPVAIKQNEHARRPYQLHITPEEHKLFTAFGEKYPQSFVLTDHLEAYALPYYNLKPISLSPAHGANSSYYHMVSYCFALESIACIADFLNSTNFEFFYSPTPLNVDYFTPVAGLGNLKIYKFDPKVYSQKSEVRSRK